MKISSTFFIFNIRRSIYEIYGIKHFQHISKFCTLVPIVNDLNNRIEQRAKQIKQEIDKTTKNLKLYNKNQKIDLIAYSLSGIDCRYALSHLGLGQISRSLSTISTPHQGSKSAQLLDRKTFKQNIFDPITRLMGVGLVPFTQFVPENIKNFNLCTPNVQNVQYYSIGGQKLPNHTFHSFKQLGNYLRLKTIHNYLYQNDGVMGHDQVKWGEYLMNFQYDHAEIVGLWGNSQRGEVFNLLKDKVRQKIHKNIAN